MDFTIGSLELNRTNPAHLGTKPVIDTAKKLYMDSFGNVTDAAPKEQINRRNRPCRKQTQERNPPENLCERPRRTAACYEKQFGEFWARTWS